MKRPTKLVWASRDKLMSRRLIARTLLMGVFFLAVIGLKTTPAVAQSAALPTLTTVTPLTPGIAMQPVTLTVMVSSVYENVGLVPSGTVDFFAGPDNYLGSVTLSPSSLVGIASLVVQLAPGSYYLGAQYSGDNAFDPSYSVPSVPLEILP